MRVDDLLDRSTALYGDHPAVAIVGGSTYSYRDLRARVGKAAAALYALGVRPGDRVAFAAENGLTYFDIYLGAARLGAIALPLNTRLTPAEAGWILDHAEPSLVLVDGPFEDLVAGVTPRVPILDVAAGDWERLLRSAHPDPPVAGAESDVALMIYTSGTTGRPKGVCLSQRALTSNALSVTISQGLKHDDVFMTATPLHHAATGTRVTSMLLDGQTHVVLPSFETGEALSAIAEHGVTTTVLVPTQLQRILRSPVLDTVDLSSFRLLVYGAAPTGLPIIRRARQLLGCDLHQGYGLTEAVTNLTALTAEDHRRGDEHLLRSCGRPVPGAHIEIRSEDGAVATDGVVGEIWVRTDKVMDGYWRDEQATREAVRDGWLRTGDLAHRDGDGFLYIAGRLKDMLISGGVNIYPREIEDVLLENDDVAEVAVVGFPDEEWGEVPVAFIVCVDGRSVDTERLREDCLVRLARPKVPQRFEIVQDLPHTASGKIRKIELREQFDAAASSAAQPTRNTHA